MKRIIAALIIAAASFAQAAPPANFATPPMPPGGFDGVPGPGKPADFKLPPSPGVFNNVPPPAPRAIAPMPRLPQQAAPRATLPAPPVQFFRPAPAPASRTIAPPTRLQPLVVPPAAPNITVPAFPPPTGPAPIGVREVAPGVFLELPEK